MSKNTDQTPHSLTLSSPAFKDGERMPVRHTCDDTNINPHLDIDGVPPSAKSLVLLMEDPDAPSGTWHHWICFNLPPTTREIPEGYEPGGISGKGTAGNLDYFGPCPPDGEHRYVFRVFALDTMLDLKAGASRAEVDEAMIGHVLDKASLTGIYSRAN